MKATSFSPTGPIATELLTPEAVQLTIGALINRLLDNAANPMVIVIDQTEGGLISIYDSETESVGAAAVVNAVTAEPADNSFEPGALNPMPFEGQ